MFVGTLIDFKDAWPILALAVILLALIFLLKSSVRDCWMVRNIPGPPGIPFIGNLFSLLGINNEQKHTLFCELHKKYGALVRFVFCGKVIIAINNPADAQTIMMNPQIRNRHPLLERIIESFLKGSLLGIRDDDWACRRKQLNKSFQFSVVVAYLDTFGKKADELAGRLAALADGRKVDIMDHLSICSMAAIIDTAIATSLGAPGLQYFTKLDEIIAMKKKMEMSVELVAARATNPFVWPLWAYHLTKNGRIAKKMSQEMFDFVDHHTAMASERIARSGDNNNSIATGGEKKLQSFNEIVSEATLTEKILPASYVRSDVMLLAIGGTETNASTMAYLLMLIAIHPEYQKKLIEEQREIFGESLRSAQSDDVSKMTFLDMALKETLRLFAPIPLLPRQIPFDLPISNGFTLPRDSFVLINNFNIHHDPLNYVDPERFWPERWLPENSVGRHPYAYLPFGAGGRNCLAIKYSQLQIKSYLSRLLRQYQFACDYTMKDLSRIESRPIIRSAVGYDVRITSR